MNKERVLIVHNYYQVPGGEDTVVTNEVKMLEDNGHKVFIYTRHNDEIKKRNIFGKFKLPFETIYSFKTIREVKKIIKENKVDIVHVHNTMPLISPSVYKAAKDCGCKVVQTVHNFRLLCPGATFTCKGEICELCLTEGLQIAIKKNCYRNSKIQTVIVVMMLLVNRLIGSYDKVDKYIALTNFNKEKLSKIIPKDKIMIKPNFSDKANISLALANEKKYFVYLGRIDKLKGISILLEAWKSIKDEDLFIVGSGPESRYVVDFIRRNKIENIHFMGNKNKDEVMNILGKAKALIVPSQWYEGFPMTIVEALSLSVPVIAGDIGNLNELIKNGENGLLFKYNESNDLIEKVLFLSNNGIIYKDLELGAEKSYINNYSSNKNYKILLNIYRS